MNGYEKKPAEATTTTNYDTHSPRNTHKFPSNIYICMIHMVVCSVIELLSAFKSMKWGKQVKKTNRQHHVH